MGKPLFSRFADAIARGASRPSATMAVMVVILLWAVCGFWFHFGEKWQLAISTGGTVVTLLMVFVIQHSQKHDSSALHIKLDEVIRVLVKADNELLDLEKASQRDLDKLRNSYHEKATEARGGVSREYKDLYE